MDRMGLLLSFLGERTDVRSGSIVVDQNRSGNSGRRGAGEMVGSEEGGGWEVRRRQDGDLYDWRRRCHDHREIQRLSGRRCCLAQEAAFGVVAGVHALDVHYAGERVASCLMEQKRVGD